MPENDKKAQNLEITTIKLKKITKERLDHVKEHERESYDEVINKALNILNICVKNPLLAGRVLRNMEATKKRGNIISQAISHSSIRPNARKTS